MKSKNGKVKMERGEVRVGNFFIKEEAEHFKMQDISSMFTLRVKKQTFPGAWIANMLNRGEGGRESLHVYVATLLAVLSPAPDDVYVAALAEASNDCLRRHRELYGMKDVSDEEQEKVLEEEQEKAEFIEQVKQLEKDGGKR